MGRWRDSWAARNPSVRLAWPMRQTRLPLWFRATESSALMGVLPDTAAASAGSAGCSFTKGSLWKSLRPDTFQKRHESLKQRRCSANGGRKVWLGAMRAVSDEMVLTLSASGTADDVAARISALLKAGLKQAVLFPLAVDGDASGAILRTIEALS